MTTVRAGAWVRGLRPPGPPRTASNALIKQPETLVVLERMETNPFGLRGQ
ncbi:hypothetical protein RB201_28275 [Streptomyces sp. S1A(2023)]